MGYYRPTALADALSLLAERTPQVLAGGTDIFPATDRPELSGDVLDITALNALSGITQDDKTIRLGAATKWTDIINADLPPAFDALKLSAREVGSIQIQNAGTIGGNLCNASPAADGVPPLLILDASIELTSNRGTRHLPLSDFILGNRRTGLQHGELLTAILIPAPDNVSRSNFLKLGARKYLIISIGMVAALITEDAGKITKSAIAIGSCSEVATRLPDLEQSLIGQSLKSADIDPNLITKALKPIDDIRATGSYRTTAAVELIRRTIAGLAK